MNFIKALSDRRSYYALGDKPEVSDDKILSTIEEVVRLVPDAMNMRSQRAVVLFGAQHKKLWDAVYDIYGGKVDKEKTDMFKAGAGTVLFFYDNKTVKGLMEKFPRYAENFVPWALQSNGMLQISVWTALRELGLGANIQHYNPVIDDKIKAMFDIDADYVLLGQMVFGSILSEPNPKESEDIKNRVSARR